MVRNKNIKNNKALWSKNEKRGLNATLLVFLLVILVFLSIPIFKEIENQKVLKNLMNQEIAFQSVCSVSNEIKFEKLNPVKIDNKTYWVCCSRCRAKLISNSNILRFATDPFSNKKLDKATAAIRQNPKNIGTVLYFKTKDNAAKFNLEREKL